MALTAEQIAIVKSTAPVLREHGVTITDTFYRHLLASHPQLKNQFSLRHQYLGTQSAALANAVLAYGLYIDDLAQLSGAVERIAQKHASLFVRPEQYPIVGQFLVAAFAEVLGSALTPEIADAWTAAYGQLADVFIKREQQLYDEAADWRDWRRFTIVRKELEADDVVSFYLEPADKKPLKRFQPGQYVTLQLPMPEMGGLRQSRQYSLSAAPHDGMTQYRVTVKKEPTVDKPDLEDLSQGKIPGVFSNLLHQQYGVGDQVEMSPPRGEFFFDAASAPADTPVVLLSVGVGATPLVSMLDAILASANGQRPVSWVHGARHASSVCFGQHVREAAARHGNVTTAVFAKNVRAGDRQGEAYDLEGRMVLDTVAGSVLHLDSPAAEYFICGPKDWMMQTRQWLTDRGVARERLHLELFNTGDV